MTDLQAHVEKSIRRRGLLRRAESVLVAVSGGVDSTVLLHVIKPLSFKYGWKPIIAHFNHRLRGRHSDADAAFVKKTARSSGLPIIMEKGEVKQLAKTDGLSLEMAARKLRHEFLARTAKKLGIRTIALAHHADDQVELFFLRVLRGAGGEGIAGMKWRSPSPASANVQLIRPLLDVTKADLETYARENQIHFRHDATNSSLDIRRNRIRHELLPLLKRHYQPAVTRTVLRTMEIIGAETDFVTATAAKWLKQKQLTAFTRLPLAVQRRCLQLQLQRLNLPVDFEIIEDLRQSSKVTVNLSAGVSVFRNTSGLLQFHTHKPAGFDTDEARAALSNSRKSLQFGGLKCHWQIVASKKASLPKKSPSGLEHFDADKIGPNIVLRHWHPGDRFHPIGMGSPVKLQNWFTNLKVPRAIRHKLVLAEAANGEIFWVQGQRISENFKLTAHTKRRLKWHWSTL